MLNVKQSTELIDYLITKYPGIDFHYSSEFGFRFNGDISFTDAELIEEFNSLTNEKPLRLLRIQRDQLLLETDWWCVSDRTPTPEQLQYRQALRDLPSTASPALDENGQLTGVTWPENPAS